ncbi:MAG: hypothetical protein IJA14_02730 [Alphaproteobacteria bacterium]|nr:hypothetical protein [Alphaproteobacteria bacterium]
MLTVSVMQLLCNQAIQAEPMYLTEDTEDMVAPYRPDLDEPVSKKMLKIEEDSSSEFAGKKEKLKVEKDNGDEVDELDEKEEKSVDESDIRDQEEIATKIKGQASEDPILLQRAADLHKLAENGIVIAQHSRDELRVDPCSRTPFEINVFDKNNLKSVAVATLQGTLDSTENNNFIMGKNPIFDSIRKDETIKKEVQQLITSLTNMSYEDADVEKAIEQTDHLLETLNSTIGIDNPFGLFIATINGGFKVLYSRTIAAQFLKEHEGSIAKSLTDFTKSASASFGGGGFAGVKASASISGSSSGGATHHSLTAVSKGIGLTGKFGYGPFAATLGASFTQMLLICSVLQNIEYGNKLTLSLEGRDLKKLQDAVKEAERLYYSFFEAGMALSKILRVVPQYTDFKFGGFTDVNRPSRINVINTDLGASASIAALKNSGVSIKVSRSVLNVYNDKNDLLALTDDSCFPLGDASKVIDKKLDRTQTFLHDKDQPKKGKTKRGYSQILNEDHSRETPSEKSVEMSLSVISGDLSYYMQVLQSLAFLNNCSSVLGVDKEAKDHIKFLEDQKHEIEKRWNVTGREQLLKAILLTTANLRKLYSSEYTVEIGKKIHSKLMHLQELLRFSKDKDTRDSKGNYSTESKIIVKKLQLGASIPGGASVSVSVQKGLQPYITVSLVVPGPLVSVVLKRLPEVINALRNTGKTKNSTLNENKVYIIEALQSSVDLLKLNVPKLSQTSTFSINFVPGVDKKPVISHYQVTTTSGVNFSTSANVGVASITASASANVGTTKF